MQSVYNRYRLLFAFSAVFIAGNALADMARLQDQPVPLAQENGTEASACLDTRAVANFCRLVYLVLADQLACSPASFSLPNVQPVSSPWLERSISRDHSFVAYRPARGPPAFC